MISEIQTPGNPLMRLRKKLFERIGIQADPQHVERASRREWMRRNAWMFASTVVSFGILVVATLLLSSISSFPPTGIPGAVAAVGASILVLYIDMRLFVWGVERFGLVLPWQFREEKAKSNQ